MDNFILQLSITFVSAATYARAVLKNGTISLDARDVMRVEMRKTSLVLIVFLPVLNATIFGLLMPVFAVEKPVEVTISDIVNNPLLWVRRKVKVRGFLSVDGRISPFSSKYLGILKEPETGKTIKVILETSEPWWTIWADFVDVHEQPLWWRELTWSGKWEIGTSTITGVVKIAVGWRGIFWCIDAEAVKSGTGAGGAACSAPQHPQPGPACERCVPGQRQHLTGPGGRAVPGGGATELPGGGAGAQPPLRRPKPKP